MTIIRAAMALLILLLPTAFARAVGFQHVLIPDGEERAIEVGIWYPSDAPMAPQRLALFTQDVAADAPVAGQHLPLIIQSHGTGGGFEGHYDTDLALAQAGFVVAAVTHTGDNYRDKSDQAKPDTFVNRARHMRRLLDYMLTQWAAHDRIDGNRVGIFGFSAGGATALIDIGGALDLAQVRAHCAEHPDEWSCRLAKERRTEVSAGAFPTASDWLRDRRIKAAVVAAPALGYAFTEESLGQISVPIQLWRGAIDGILPHPHYAQAIYDGLGTKPDYRVVPNAGHFSFLAPCSTALALAVPEICADAPGFDRSRFHEEFNHAVVAFFAAKLTSP